MLHGKDLQMIANTDNHLFIIFFKRICDSQICPSLYIQINENDYLYELSKRLPIISTRINLVHEFSNEIIITAIYDNPLSMQEPWYKAAAHSFFAVFLPII